MAVDKAAMLAALAQQGSAGLKAYQDAQASIAAQKQEALRLALSSGIAGSANQGAQDQLARTVGQGYDSRAAQLTSNQATSQDWFARQQASAGVWADTMSGLQEAVLARALADAAGGGGSGGGSGGGGGGGKEKEFDWEKNLSEKFGTTDRGLDGIYAEAKGLGLNSDNPEMRGMPRYLQTRGYAENEYGIPADVTALEFGPSEFQSLAETAKPTLKNFRTLYLDPKEGAVARKGNQSGPIKQFVGRMNPKQQKQAKKIISKQRRKGK
jgi:hypothetical protein